jgi:threonine dehydrogenase-like Zn-dependent dehydrogenase
MKAAVFHKPGVIQCDNVDDPTIEAPQDIILKVTATAICGSDLHIYNGFFPQSRPMVLGHEFMGIVEEIGPQVTAVAKGDRVVVPFPIACGTCFFCNHGLPGHCENSNPEHYGPEGGMKEQKGGGLFGYNICMEATMAARPNMCVFRMPTSVRGKSRRGSPTRRFCFLPTSFPLDTPASIGRE